MKKHSYGNRLYKFRIVHVRLQHNIFSVYLLLTYFCSKHVKWYTKRHSYLLLSTSVYTEQHSFYAIISEAWGILKVWDFCHPFVLDKRVVEGNLYRTTFFVRPNRACNNYAIEFNLVVPNIARCTIRRTEYITLVSFPFKIPEYARPTYCSYCLFTYTFFLFRWRQILVSFEKSISIIDAWCSEDGTFACRLGQYRFYSNSLNCFCKNYLFFIWLTKNNLLPLQKFFEYSLLSIHTRSYTIMDDFRI